MPSTHALRYNKNPMAQALYWLAGRFTGLTAVLAEPGEDPRTLPLGGPVPAWVGRLLRVLGVLGRHEELRSAGELTPAGRLRLALRGAVRAEFAPGAADRFRSLVIRESHDFAALAALVTSAA